MKQVLSLVLGVCLCGASPKALAQSHAIRFGADSEGGAPYILPNPKQPEKVIGFEVDLMEAVGRHLHRPVEFVQNQWDGLIPGLQRGNYDVAVNGLEILDDRKAQVNFSIPYYACGEQLSVRAEETRIAGMKDLRGLKVGTLKSSFAQRLLEKQGDIHVVTYENQNNAYDDLLLARLDAVLMDWPIALYYSRPQPGLKWVGAPMEAVQYGMAVRKEELAWLKDLNRALQALMASGELQAIYEKWGIWNEETKALFAKNLQPNTSVYEEVTQNVASSLSWDARLKQVASYVPTLVFRGVPMTLLISVLAMVLAVALGAVLSMTQLLGPKSLALLARAYVEGVRGTPLLIQLYFIFYGLPHLGLRLSPLWAAVLGLGLNYAAYEAENYRAGIAAVPFPQWEAGLSLGTTRFQCLRDIILPQAFRWMLPPVTNDFISLLKDSSIVSVITMVELTKVYGQLAAASYDYIGLGVVTAALYFLMGWPFVRLSRWAERRLSGEKQVSEVSKMPDTVCETNSVPNLTASV